MRYPSIAHGPNGTRSSMAPARNQSPRGLAPISVGPQNGKVLLENDSGIPDFQKFRDSPVFEIQGYPANLRIGHFWKTH